MCSRNLLLEFRTSSLHGSEFWRPAATLIFVMKTAWKPLLAAVAAGLMLSGCQTSGTAALVGNTRISETQVNDTIAACEEAGAPLLGEAAAGNRGSVVFSMAAGEVARTDKTIREFLPADEELDAALATLPPAVLNAPECKAYFDGTLRFNQAFQKMQETAPEQLEASLSEAVNRIKLNPKYGRLKADEAGVTQKQSGSMSKAINPTLLGN